MSYEVVIFYHLHMTLNISGTFTEYPHIKSANISGQALT